MFKHTHTHTHHLSMPMFADRFSFTIHNMDSTSKKETRNKKQECKVSLEMKVEHMKC